jgi:hypothetical protein
VNDIHPNHLYLPLRTQLPWKIGVESMSFDIIHENTI